MDLMAALVAALLIHKLTSRIAPNLGTGFNRVSKTGSVCDFVTY